MSNNGILMLFCNVSTKRNRVTKTVRTLEMRKMDTKKEMPLTENSSNNQLTIYEYFILFALISVYIFEIYSANEMKGDISYNDRI